MSTLYWAQKDTGKIFFARAFMKNKCGPSFTGSTGQPKWLRNKPNSTALFDSCKTTIKQNRPRGLVYS